MEPIPKSVMRIPRSSRTMGVFYHTYAIMQIVMIQPVEHTKNNGDKHGIIRRVISDGQGLVLLDTRVPTRSGGGVRLLQLRVIERPRPPMQSNAVATKTEKQAE